MKDVLKEMLKGLVAWRLVCAALVICLAPAAYAADDDKDAPKAESGASAEPSDAKAAEDADKDDGDKQQSDEGDADKDGADKEDAKDSSDKEAAAPGENRKGSVRLKDLIVDGFLIRTTVFVPADAVTRQTGSVSADAMVLTLQKETAIAICYYTFKAYVKGGRGLLRIPSCTVYD